MKVVVKRAVRSCLVVSIAGMMVGLSCVVAQADMLYYLPFQDASGNSSLANFGTVGGTATTYGGGGYTNSTPPIAGRAFARDIPAANNGALVLPGSYTRLALTNSGDRISVLAWVKLHGTQTVQGIANAIGTGVKDGWTFNLRDTRKITFLFGYGTAYIQRQSSVQVPIGEWTHLAFTFTVGNPSSDFKFYMNGVSVAHTGGELSGLVAAKNPNIPIKIGRRDSDSWALNGLIDEVRLYDEILTEQQIREIMTPPQGTIIAVK